MADGDILEKGPEGIELPEPEGGLGRPVGSDTPLAVAEGGNGSYNSPIGVLLVPLAICSTDCLDFDDPRVLVEPAWLGGWEPGDILGGNHLVVDTVDDRLVLDSDRAFVNDVELFELERGLESSQSLDRLSCVLELDLGVLALLVLGLELV